MQHAGIDQCFHQRDHCRAISQFDQGQAPRAERSVTLGNRKKQVEQLMQSATIFPVVEERSHRLLRDAGHYLFQRALIVKKLQLERWSLQAHLRTPRAFQKGECPRMAGEQFFTAGNQGRFQGR